MKKIITICICLAVLGVFIFLGTKVLAPTPESHSPLTPETTAPEHFSVNQFENFNYILTVPKNATENMPLLVYLHGEDGRSNNPNFLLQQPGFPRSHILGELEQIPAYVLIPLIPANTAGWERIKPELISLIDKVAADCKSDVSKICLTGHGMGGTGTWKLAATYPDKFSCIVPISGSIANVDSNVQALKGMPVWAFASNADTVTPASYTTEFISALQKVNDNCHITVFEGYPHNATWTAYQLESYNVIQWMLAQ